MAPLRDNQPIATGPPTPGSHAAWTPREGALCSGWRGAADAFLPHAGVRPPRGCRAGPVHLRPGQQAPVPRGPGPAPAGEVPPAAQPPLLPAVPEESRPPRAVGRLLPQPGVPGN